MTRTNAREIAIHFTFELSFSNLSADELLDEFFNREYFALLGEEEPLYAEFPNEKQRAYICSLVRGAFEHGAELDGYIEKYAVGWKFSRIGRVAAAIMRVARINPELNASRSVMQDSSLVQSLNFSKVSFCFSVSPEFNSSSFLHISLTSLSTLVPRLIYLSCGLMLP